MPKSHWIKIDRADAHIDALDHSVEAWRSENPYTFREEYEPHEPVDPFIEVEEGWVRTSLRLRVPDAYPTEWSAFIGDAIHNLRSSLDHMAFALNANGYAKANGGAALPPREVKLSEFPIIGDDDSKGNPGMGAAMFAERIKRRLRLADPAAIAIIDRVQPYRRGPKFTATPLWFIHDLDIIDKHQQVVLAAVTTEQLRINRMFIQGPILDSGIGFAGPLDDGDEIAYWITPPDSAAQYDLGITWEVGFGKGTAPVGWPVIKTLRALHDFVRKIASDLDSYM